MGGMRAGAPVIPAKAGILWRPAATPGGRAHSRPEVPAFAGTTSMIP